MERIKKFIYGFLAAYAVAVACILVFLYRSTFPGPFAYAGIDSIAGSKQVFHYVHRYNLTGGTEIWVFEIPQNYYERLYKDCSIIKYQPGPYLITGQGGVIAGTGAEKYLNPSAPSCYDASGDHFTTNISEFRGDKLVIYYDHVL